MAKEKKKLCPLTFTLALPAGPVTWKPGLVILGSATATPCMKTCAWYKDGECAVLTLAKQASE